MEGFFDELGVTEEEVKRETPIVPTCIKCGRYKKGKNPKIPYSGKGKKKILIVGEFPEEKDDRKGKNFIGEIGEFLREVLNKLGYDLDLDFYSTNSLICYSPNNPTKLQINACRTKVFNTFNELNPVGLILLGPTAYSSFLEHRMTGRLTGVSFNNFLGHCIPDQFLGAWVGITYNPAHILKTKWDKTLKKIWIDHLTYFIETMKEPVKIFKNPEINIILEEEKAINILNKLRKTEKILAWDYETTGIKPHRKEQEIYTASISNGKKAWAFPFFDSKEFKLSWKKFLTSHKILKLSHQKRFEAIWTKEKLGYWPKNPQWCTLLAQHSLKNKGRVGLKFLTYVNEGIMGYDKNTANFLGSTKKGEDEKSNNSLNRIKEAKLDDILYYNGLDSLYGYKLWEKQATKLKGNLLEGLHFFMEGDQVLSEIHQYGFILDRERIEKWKKRIEKKTNNIKKRILDSEELKNWDKNREFKINSPDDMKYILFDILKLKSTKETVSGKKSVDQESLSKFNIPFTEKVLEYRKWLKAKDTYISQYEREEVNGLLHAFFNLGKVDTFRSSSSSPNLQNIPKRDKTIKSIIRSFFRPRPGCRIVERDYGQMEVRIAACYTKDKNLIAYCSDDSKDMHRDNAVHLFLRKPDEVTKIERFITKNKFVFREFYGGYYEQAAPEIWADMPKESKIHLKSKGIKREKDFIEHVRVVEENLWNMFPEFAAWKDSFVKKYEKKGYIDLLTGFRCYGPMKRNEINNYCIQGSAFHVLLWTLIEIHKLIEKEGLKSRFLGQIHDAAVSNEYPEEEEIIDKWFIEYGLNKVKEHWPWIIVPLKIEKERSEINGDWANMTDMGELK